MGFVSTLFAPIRLLLGLVYFLVLVALWIFSLVVVWPLGSVIACCVGYPKPRPREVLEPKSVHPENPPFSVAVVGGGWTGMQCAKELIDRGVRVRLFEKHDDIGGTWHPALSYSSLQLHSPTYTNELQGFPYPNQERRFEKLHAQEVREYLKQFFNHYSLAEISSFSTQVLAVHHHSATGKADITVKNLRTGQEERLADFDLVLFTGFASVPTMPSIKNEGFNGQLMHSMELKPEDGDRMVAQGQRVVVVGGNKSATDMMIMFERKGYRNATWLYRQPYFFMKYETLTMPVTPTINRMYSMIRGFFFAVSITLSLFSHRLMLIAGWLFGTLRCVRGFHTDGRKFHLGVLDKDQFAVMQRVKGVKGEPVAFTPKGVRLANGKELEADVIVCATGYSTGLRDVKMDIDGTEYRKQVTGLYQGLVDPDLPSLALAAQNVYTFGPMRGVSLAQHVWRVLCLRPSQDAMRKSVKGNLFRCRVDDSFLFSSKGCFMELWTRSLLDLVRTGVLPLGALIKNVVDVFVLNDMEVVHLNPPHPSKVPKVGPGGYERMAD